MSLLNDALRKNRSQSRIRPPFASGKETKAQRAGKNIRPQTWLIIAGGVILSGLTLSGYVYFATEKSPNSAQPVSAVYQTTIETEKPPAAVQAIPAIAEKALPPSNEPESKGEVSALKPNQTESISPSSENGAQLPLIATEPEILPFKKKDFKKLKPPVAPTKPSLRPDPPKNDLPTGLKPQLDHLYTKARRYHRQGQLDQAIFLYNEIIKIDSQHFDARFNLISTYLQTGAYHKAHILANSLNHQYPENPDVMLNLAAACIGIGQASNGLLLLNQAKQQPRAPLYEIYLHQGIAHRHLGDVKNAIDCYRRAEKLQPQEPRLLFNLALAYDQQQRYPEAIKYYMAYIKADNSDPAKDRDLVNQRIRQLQADTIKPATGGDPPK